MYVKNAWYVAAWADALVHSLTHLRIMDQPVLLYRTSGGEAVAMEDRCCHRRVPLHRGTLVGDLVQCGYHGFTFDCRGKCVSIPNQEQIPPSACVKSYRVCEKHHLIWIWMGDGSLADEGLVPDFSILSDASHAWQSDYMHAKANYRLITDNLNDLSHLTFVHSSTIGNQSTALAELEVENSAADVTQTRWMIDTPPPPTYRRLAGFSENIDRWQVIKFLPPSCVRIRTGGRRISTGAKNFDGPETIGMYALHAITPETETTSHYFWAQTHDFRSGEPDVTQALFLEIQKAFHEDLEVFAAQQESIKDDPDHTEVSCRADRAQLLARKLVDRLLEHEASSTAS